MGNALRDMMFDIDGFVNVEIDLEQFKIGDEFILLNNDNNIDGFYNLINIKHWEEEYIDMAYSTMDKYTKWTFKNKNTNIILEYIDGYCIDKNKDFKTFLKNGKLRRLSKNIENIDETYVEVFDDKEYRLDKTILAIFIQYYYTSDEYKIKNINPMKFTKEDDYKRFKTGINKQLNRLTLDRSKYCMKVCKRKYERINNKDIKSDTYSKHAIISEDSIESVLEY